MPQFEIQRRAAAPAFVRARSAQDAVRRHAELPADPGRQSIALAGAEPGTGWQAVTVDGEPWGRVRPRDRMRFRRD